MWLLILILIIILCLQISGSSEKFPQKLKNWGREKYKKYPQDSYLIPHLGQRKLLLSEIEFLTKYTYNVVYAGAGPGHHIKYLAKLFPHLKFELYDPRDFSPELYKLKNIKIYQEYFTEETAKKYNKNWVFICDIRTSPSNFPNSPNSGNLENSEFENEVLENLKQQENWCKIMKPKMACLKFRLPFNLAGQKFKYFDGEIYLQPWVGIDSAETRLWTNCEKYKIYDCSEYEEQLFYYNLNIRLGNFNIGQPEPFDFCADCAHEFHIWEEYKKKFKSSENILELAKGYEQFFNIGPHGKYRNLKPSERKLKLKLDIEKFYKTYHLKESEDKGAQTKRI